MILLGDRVSGMNLSTQEVDLLKCIGGHVAASLLNVRLARKLLQTRELETFRTMSAFFVHDLKNAASTLNLMLRNLPSHFDDPAFRQDTLRGLGTMSAHINQLIARLGQVRDDLQTRPVMADFNGLVARAVAEAEMTPDIVVHTDLRPLPEMPLDEEKIKTVVTNLVINSREAVTARFRRADTTHFTRAPGADPAPFPSRHGEIRIATRQQDRFLVLSVSDNGCGMEPQFVQLSLFRAFQTTKKNGLGIGLFQSRAIIEAHGGRIEVESEPGIETVFRVYLPLAASPAPLERRSAVESEVSPKPSFDLTRDLLCAPSRASSQLTLEGLQLPEETARSHKNC